MSEVKKLNKAIRELKIKKIAEIEYVESILSKTARVFFDHMSKRFLTYSQIIKMNGDKND